MILIGCTHGALICAVYFSLVCLPFSPKTVELMGKTLYKVYYLQSTPESIEIRRVFLVACTVKYFFFLSVVDLKFITFLRKLWFPSSSSNSILRA